MISLIAARSTNGVIGINNTMPWHLEGELKYFKKVTLNHAVVMGRKTFESLGNTPLPHRDNIVLSRRTHTDKRSDAMYVSDHDTIVQQQIPHTDLSDIFVIGGEQIYRLFMPYADRLIITEVSLHVEGDAYFPEFSEKEWRLDHSEPMTYYDRVSRQDVSCLHNTYVRIRGDELIP